MSLEANIQTLTAAVSQLTAVLQSQGVSVPQTAAPVQQAAPAPVAVPVQQPVQMPSPPTFAVTPPAPAPAPVVAAPAAPVSVCPFSDTNGLIQYTMSAYQAMGPQKGAGIQGVLQQLGYVNINDVKPEHFGQFYQAVEALKVS